jgi:hypothetical protein
MLGAFSHGHRQRCGNITGANRLVAVRVESYSITDIGGKRFYRPLPLRQGGMSRERYDAIVIGTGRPSLAVWLARQAGKSPSSSASAGGTCVNTGCTPTKTLWRAYAAHLAARAADYGDHRGPSSST